MKLIPAFIRRRIAHRPNLVKIVDNIGWLFFDKILRMGVGVLVWVWIARYLGPEQFGLVNFALAFTGLFGAVAGLGLQGIVVRDLLRDPESASLTLGTAALLQIIGGVVTFLLILGSIAYLRPEDSLARSVVAILGAIMMFKASEIAVYWFESQVQSKYTVWVQNSVFAVFAALKGVMILQGASIFAFVWAMLCEAAVVAFILLFVMSLRGPRLASLAFSFAHAKTLLKDSWPLFLAAAAITVYVKTDQIMLGQMIGDESVGIYGAAVRISEAWYFVPVVIVSSLLPTILDAQKRGKELYYEKIQYLYDLMVIISLSVALPMTFLAAPLIRLLFGADYAEAGIVLVIHIWATVFVSLGVASSTWFLAENRLMLSLQRTLLGAVANVALNLLLIPDYGVVGAAVALVISQALASLFFDVLHRETHKMFLMKLSSLNPVAVYKRWCLAKW